VTAFLVVPLYHDTVLPIINAVLFFWLYVARLLFLLASVRAPIDDNNVDSCHSKMFGSHVQLFYHPPSPKRINVEYGRMLSLGCMQSLLSLASRTSDGLIVPTTVAAYCRNPWSNVNSIGTTRFRSSRTRV